MGRAQTQVKIVIEGHGEVVVPAGTTPLEILKQTGMKTPYPAVAVRVNNKVRELKSPLEADGTLSFVMLNTRDGMSVYRRSLAFLLIRAAREVFDNARLFIRHSLSKGYYCEIDLGRMLAPDDLNALEKRMRELIAADEPFVRQEIGVNEAVGLFEKDNQSDKVGVLKYRKESTVSIYRFGEIVDYFYGCLTPSAAYVSRFELRYYPPGFILRFPVESDPYRIPAFEEQKKMAEIFREYLQWGRIMGITNVGLMNQFVERGESRRVTRVAEALHEKKMARIADLISEKITCPRLVLISGPSGSGKTTFSKRLAIQMSVNGLKNVTLSLDNYFLDREETPRDETGEYDFEAPEALDLDLLNSQLLDLIAGKEVKIPRFSFKSGKRAGWRKFRLEPDRILILEGIHALNPIVTPSIPAIMKFEIYVSALSQLNIDNHNRVPTTDTRKLRRIVRDNLFRGYAAHDTLVRWESIRRGEELYIFPYQEEADVMFNSSLVHELGVLKTYAEKLLRKIGEGSEEYAEARRLLRFLSYVLEVPVDEVPRNSILREFIGGSIFKY